MRSGRIGSACWPGPDGPCIDLGSATEARATVERTGRGARVPTMTRPGEAK